jgi:dipeptidase E
MAAAPVPRIVAIGGGGFSTEDYSLRQERWLLSLARRAQPRVLFVATASGDRELYHLRFFKAFSRLDCQADTLGFFPYDMKRDYAQAVREADMVFVGGGNTPAMLAVWREFGFDVALREAWQAGTVIAGISAGANAWFEHYVTDSVPGGGVRPGLGWLPGTFCPHLDSETWRPDVLRACSGPLAGAGEHVAVLYEGTQWQAAVHDAAPGAQPLCWRRDASAGELQAVQAQALPPSPG